MHRHSIGRYHLKGSERKRSEEKRKASQSLPKYSSAANPCAPMSLDHRIKCNYLTCRKELTDRALVTTCSHIYCIECAGLLQLVSRPFGSCPACEGSVPAGTSPQATSIVHLNPSDDFKSTVLSGLSPNDIIECAGRALSFWGYQTTQEM